MSILTGTIWGGINSVVATAITTFKFKPWESSFCSSETIFARDVAKKTSELAPFFIQLAEDQIAKTWCAFSTCTVNSFVGCVAGGSLSYWGTLKKSPFVMAISIKASDYLNQAILEVGYTLPEKIEEHLEIEDPRLTKLIVESFSVLAVWSSLKLSFTMSERLCSWLDRGTKIHW